VLHAGISKQVTLTQMSHN